jgi:hypothetical protein
MTTGKNIKGLEQILYRTFKAIADELERKATAALWKLAKSHPNDSVIFCSAMGSITFSIGDRFEIVRPPIMKTFSRIEGDFGWNAIPVVRLEIKAGKLDRRTDW